MNQVWVFPLAAFHFAGGFSRRGLDTVRAVLFGTATSVPGSLLMLQSVLASRAPVSAVGFPSQLPVLRPVAVEPVFQLLLKPSKGVFPEKDILLGGFRAVCLPSKTAG